MARDRRCLHRRRSARREHYPEEEDLARYVLGIGCEYQVQPEDNGYRGWLTEIASRVEAAT